MHLLVMSLRGQLHSWLMWFMDMRASPDRVGSWQLDLRPIAAIWHYLDPSGRRAPIWLSGLSGRPRGWPIWLSGPIWAYLGLSGTQVGALSGYLEPPLGSKKIPFLEIGVYAPGALPVPGVSPRGWTTRAASRKS